jgi:hypothetical protein
MMKELKRIGERFKLAKCRAVVRKSVRMLHGCSPVPRPPSYAYIPHILVPIPYLVWLVRNLQIV